ncbi:MAG: hypothetical protein DMG78_16775 [Acidobacteria bacterium]|nr:MAG: hypothetical protein DMG78_16775 [Acidobacteriota bacterium]
MYGTVVLEKLGWFSGNGETSAPESFAERRENLFSFGDQVGPEEGNTAGRITDLGTDLETMIGCPHPICCKSKIGGEPKGFLSGQLQRHG